MPLELLNQESILILFRLGILMAAALLCATMAMLAIRESHPSTTGRLFPWLLGVGAIWYSFLPLQHFLYPHFEALVRNQRLSLPTGVLRPGLLLFMAVLAHCYASDLPHQKSWVHRFSVWMIYPPTLLVFGVMGVFRIYALIVISEGGVWTSQEQLMSVLCLVIVFYDLSLLFLFYWKLTELSGRSSIWITVFLIEAVLIWGTFLQWSKSTSIAVGYSDLMSLLLPLPLAIWPAYTRARFRFFDVLIKRGLSTLVLVGLIASGLVVYFFLSTKLAQSFSSSSVSLKFTPVKVFVSSSLIALFLLPPVVLFLVLRTSLDAWVDKVLLKRPDYAFEFGQLVLQLQQAKDETDALQRVTETLIRVMQAERVNFVGPGRDHQPNNGFSEIATSEVASLPSPSFGEGPIQSLIPGTQLRAIVASGPKTFGMIQVIGCTEGLRYLSEDMNFLERVAGQLAGTLLTLQTQKERAEQARQEQVLKDLAAQAHLRALQAQMNPHFLFNCLNLLNSLVRIDPERARKVMQCLAAVFRYTLDTTKQETVTLGEELGFVENYLEIAKARFGTRLSTIIDVPNEFHSVTMMPMLLQPLVENALHHGIEPKVGPGVLRVSAKAEEEWLSLEVSDNGVGLNSSEAQTAGSDVNDEHAGIGLRNIAERLQAQYGTTYVFQSVPNQGTTIQIRIPLTSQKIMSSTKQPVVELDQEDV